MAGCTATGQDGAGQGGTYLIPRRVRNCINSVVDACHVVGRFQHVIEFSRDRIVDEPDECGNGDIPVDWGLGLGLGFCLLPKWADSLNDMMMTTQRY